MVYEYFLQFGRLHFYFVSLAVQKLFTLMQFHLFLFACAKYTPIDYVSIILPTQSSFSLGSYIVLKAGGGGKTLDIILQYKLKLFKIPRFGFSLIR